MMSTVMKKEEMFEHLKGGLIVSCQALPGEPLFKQEGGVMNLMAKAALEAGAVGIRAQGVEDIRQIKETVDLPVIGIIKKSYPDYEQYITVTMDEIDALVDAGSDIIALDATMRPRGDGLTINQFIAKVKEKYPDIRLMADISTLEEGINAQEAGVDCVGSTLSGYTDYSIQKDGPDFELMQELVTNLTIPIIAEGKIHTPEQARKAMDLGVHCVVVGGAITRPLEITNRFIKAIHKEK